MNVLSTPWRRAFSTAGALEAVQGLAGGKLDPACVAALVVRAGEVRSIQERFPEPPAPLRK